MKFFVYFFLFILSFGYTYAADDFSIITEAADGDYISAGKDWDFSTENGDVVKVRGLYSKPYEEGVEISVENFDISSMRFSFSPGDAAEIEEGKLYTPAKRFPFNDSFYGIDISGDGRGCNQIWGRYYVHAYKIVDGELESVAIDFEQRCEGKNRPSLRGSIRYNSSIPSNCTPGACAKVKEILGGTPEVGGGTAEKKFSIVTEASNGDYISAGKDRNFTSENGDIIKIQGLYNQGYEKGVEFKIENFDISYMNFSFSPGNIFEIEEGKLYTPAKRFPFNDSFYGIDISGDGRWCNQIWGRYYVHEYKIVADELESVAIDFEQKCEGKTGPSLWGSIRYNSSVPANCTPGSCAKVKELLQQGGEVQINPDQKRFSLITEASNGDYISQGKDRNFTDTNGDSMKVDDLYNKGYEKGVAFSIENFDVSSMDFSFSPGSKSEIEAGRLYAPAKRFPFNDSFYGIDISGDGRGCNQIWGRYYVHAYEVVDGELESVAIDFEQKCEGKTGPSLWGSLRYNSSVPANCTPGSCAKVKELLQGDLTETTTSTTETSTTTANATPTTQETTSSTTTNSTTNTTTTNVPTTATTNHSTTATTNTANPTTPQTTTTQTRIPTTTTENTSVSSQKNTTLQMKINTIVHRLISNKTDEEAVSYLLKMVFILEKIHDRTSSLATKKVITLLSNAMQEKIVEKLPR